MSTQNFKITFNTWNNNRFYYNNEEVKSVIVPGIEGNFEVLGRHIPTVGVLRAGTVTVIPTSGEKREIFVSSGMVTVNPGQNVQISTQEAVERDEVDASVIAAETEKYEKLANSDNAVEKATGQIGKEVMRSLNVFVNPK
jgi:F-type H+-transporting ATPase subunit delta